MAQAGDKCDFTGTLIVVPDVGSLNLPGAKAESGSGRGKAEQGGTDGVSGLKALGVRDLTYRLRSSKVDGPFHGQKWNLS